MKSILAILILTFAGIGVARGDAFIGTSMFNLDTDVGDFNGVNLVGGYHFGDVLGGLFSVRGRYMILAEDETVNGARVELKDMWGGDIVITYPVSGAGGLNPYAFIGQTKAKAKASKNGETASATDSATNYGAGLTYDVREAVTVSGELMDIDGSTMMSFAIKANF